MPPWSVSVRTDRELLSRPPDTVRAARIGVTAGVQDDVQDSGPTCREAIQVEMHGRMNHEVALLASPDAVDAVLLVTPLEHNRDVRRRMAMQCRAGAGRMASHEGAPPCGCDHGSHPVILRSMGVWPQSPRILRHGVVF